MRAFLLKMPYQTTQHLPAGQILTVTADASSSGTVQRLANPGDGATRYSPQSISASASLKFGPYLHDRQYLITSNDGLLSSVTTAGESMADGRVGIGEFANTGLAVSEGVNFYFGPDWSTVSTYLPFAPYENNIITSDGALGNTGLYVAGVGSNPFGLIIDGVVTDDTTGTGLNLDATSRGSGDVTALLGANIGARHFSTGTLTKAVGVQVAFVKGGSAGVISTAAGIDIFGITQGSTNYAIHIEAQDSGVNDYAIKSEGGRVCFDNTPVPATADAAGTKGEIAWDADHIYVCVATDTWKRTALATWP